MPYIDPSVLANTIENAKCKVGELSDKYINAVNAGTGCECALADLRMLIFTIKALECCSSESTCGLSIEETLRLMESTMIDCAAPTCTSSVSSPVFPPMPTPLIVSLINVEEDDDPRGSFSTLNFIGAGITDVTVTNAGGGQANITITTNDNILKIYYSQLQALVSSNSVTPYTYYWIVDAGDGEGSNLGSYKAECEPAYYTDPLTSTIHNTGIIVKALTTNSFELDAVYLARVPNYSYPTFMPGKNYVANTYVVSYNQVFKCLTGGVYFTEPAEDLTNWEYIYRNKITHYRSEPQSCTYNFMPTMYDGLAGSTFGVVRKRWDRRGNVLENINPNPLGNEFIKKCFRWGTDNVKSNTINFWDDSYRSAPSELWRRPTFQLQRANYSSVVSFYNNKIDVDLKGTSSGNLKNYGTRFINVYLDATGEFSGNEVNNSAIGNIKSISGVTGTQNVKIVDNTINDSALYNINFYQCVGNKITNESIIGDIAYTNSSSNILTDGMSISSLLTDSMLLGLGSKQWPVDADSCTSTTLAGETTVTFIDSVYGSVPTYAAVGDIVYFKTSSDFNLQGLYKTVTQIVSSNQIKIDGAYSPTGLVEVIFYYPSIKTSFYRFNNNNISNSVLRGLNKNTTASANQTIFEENNLDKAYLENYVTHTPSLTYVFDSRAVFDSDGIEFGLGSGFKRNKISHTAIIGSKVNGIFNNNIIEGATFLSNKVLGFEGTFLSNSILSDKGISSFGYGSMYGGINGVIFYNNSFQSGSSFSRNTVTQENMISTVTIQSNASISDTKFLGTTYNNPSPGYGTASSPGLSNVTVRTYVAFDNNILRGRNAAIYNAILDVKSTAGTNYQIKKQSYYTNNIKELEIKDFTIDGYGNSGSYNIIYPQLFGSGYNAIIGITNITQVSPSTQTINGITYNVAKFQLTIKTEQPHMINASHVNKEVIINIGGLSNTIKIVGPVSPASSKYYSFTNVYSNAKVLSITDNYTFVCEVSTAGQYAPSIDHYFLSNTASPNDSYGTAWPGQGINTASTYSDVNDIYGIVQFPKWYKQYRWGTWDYTTARNSVISSESFEPQIRIAVAADTIPTSTDEDKKFIYRDWATTATPLYNPSTNVVSLPYYVNQFSTTVIFGSFTAGTYQVNKIQFMPEMVPVKFVTMPGCDIQFNLTAIASATADQIVRDSASASITIKSYYRSGSTTEIVYDEVVMMKNNGLIKIMSKTINQ